MSKKTKTTAAPGRQFGAWLAAPMILWAFAFVGVSLLYIIGLSFLQGNGAMGVNMVVTTANYTRLVEPAYGQVLLNSLRLAGIITLICLLVGYPFGYVMANARPTTQAILMLLIMVPFWTNALIRLYGWRLLLAANGPLNTLLLNLGIIKEPLSLLYNDASVMTGMVYALLPFMILPNYTAVEKMDWSVVEASRDLGANPALAFLTVTLPLTFSGILAGCVLVFIPSVGLFFISDLLGGSKTPLAGNLINDAMKKSRDLPFAASLSVVLLGVTGVIISLFRKTGGRAADLGIF